MNGYEEAKTLFRRMRVTLRGGLPPLRVWLNARLVPLGDREDYIRASVNAIFAPFHYAAISPPDPMNDALNLKSYIRDIPDFPKPGIMFRDITPLLASPGAFRAAIEQLAAKYRAARIDVIVAAEARGFIFAAPLAVALGAGFVPIRKPGKLPFDTHAFHYDLEYGSDTLEMHVDGLQPGQRVLVIDDLLATGGTVKACTQLVERCGGTIVGCAFAIELEALNGRKAIEPHECFSLVQY